jgi:hypothetical protein
MKANPMVDGLGSTSSLLHSHSDRRRGNRYGMAQQEFSTKFGATRRVDEAGKCTILEGDGKIANGDISEDQVSAMVKRFGEGRGFRLEKLGRSM